jgi:hypothetical protein
LLECSGAMRQPIFLHEPYDLQSVHANDWYTNSSSRYFISWFEYFFKNLIFPSEARPKAKLRSPEAELFSSLGNWVGTEKKVDKKKRYDDDATHIFCTTPLFLLQILRKCQFLKKISGFCQTAFIFWEREKFQDFVIFYKKIDFCMDFLLINKYSKSRLWSNYL